MARSIQEIQNSFAHMNSKERTKTIRKEVADLWEKYRNLVPFVRDGYEVERKSFITSNGRQEECINYISQVETALEQPKTEVVKDVEVTTNGEDVVEIVNPIVEKSTVQTLETVPQAKIETEYSDSEAEKLDIAEKLYFATAAQDDLTGLREYQLNLCRTQKYFLPEFAILVSRTRVIIEDYANAKSPEGKAHPGSIQKIRVEVMRCLAEIIKPENDKFLPVNDRTLEDTFKDFDTSVRGAFSDIGAAKYKLNKARSEAAEEDVRAIKVLPYISWAIHTVDNLPQSAAKWKEVAIAVMLLTGRRQSEVMSSGLFTYVDDSHVIFEGQLKRHIAELVPPENIPVLGKAAQGVVNAIAWLEKFNKRTLPESRNVDAIQKAAKVSHDRCSRYIAEAMATLCSLCQITNGKEWVVAEANKQSNKFKGHLNRQIYAQVCSALFNDANESKKRVYISRILLENRDAALSYDRDIEIQDTDDLKALCGSFRDE